MARSESLFRFILVLSLFLSYLSVAVRPAAACFCLLPPEFEADYAISDAVFTGRVIDVEWGRRSLLFNNRITYAIAPKLAAKMFWRNNLRRVEFEVNQAWKGVETTTVIVRTGRGGGDCGMGFDPGREYLVYAREFEGMLLTSVCSRTAGVTAFQATQDLTTLAGEPTLPLREPAGRGTLAVWGAVFFVIAAVWAVRLNKRR